MNINSTAGFALPRKKLVAALKLAGYKIPDDATFGMEVDGECFHLNPNDSIEVSWTITTDIGGPE